MGSESAYVSAIEELIPSIVPLGLSKGVFVAARLRPSGFDDFFIDWLEEPPPMLLAGRTGCLEAALVCFEGAWLLAGSFPFAFPLVTFLTIDSTIYYITLASIPSLIQNFFTR